MIGTRHEEYNRFTNKLPFVLNANIKRTRLLHSKDNNWHENPEIQICTQGEGFVLLNGKKYCFTKNDIIAVNSNVLHYTGTQSQLTYTCLIVSTEFCKQVGIDPDFTTFTPLVKSDALVKLFGSLTEIYLNESAPLRIAKLNKIVLEILIELAENHSVQSKTADLSPKKFACTKLALEYIRSNYNRKISLDDIARHAMTDKYALCREFKLTTGQTVVENINNYRCIKAIDYLSAGYNVAETASLCGFSNLSFFTKIFKKYIGSLPSKYRKNNAKQL